MTGPKEPPIPEDEQGGPDSEKAKAQRQGNAAPASHRRRENGNGHSEKDQHPTVTLKHIPFERAKVVALYAAVAAASFAAWFAWQQVDIARDTARKELRAYLFTELAENISRESEQFERVRLRFNNGGQTPAYRLACDVRAFTAHPKVGESWTWKFPPRNNLTCRIGVLAKTASRFFKTDDPITTDGLIEGERPLFVVGVIYYDDIYAKPHWITFCMQWSRDNLTPEGATYCNVYNETDETLPDLPKRGPLVTFPISN